MFLSLFEHPTAEQNDPKMPNILFAAQAKQQKKHIVNVPQMLKMLNPGVQQDKNCEFNRI